MVGLVANLITGALTRLSIRMVPGSDIVWEPAIEREQFAEWLSRAEDSMGCHIPWWVVQLPQDRRRRRFNLLLLNADRVPVGFAKFTMNVSNPMSLKALERFGSEPPRSFWAPKLVLAEQLGSYSSVLTTAMPNRPHRPAHLDRECRRAILHEIRVRLDDLSTSEVTMHGDFSPWNVRRFSGGDVAVVDWEEVTSGVAGADELWYLIWTLGMRQNGLQRVITEFQRDSPYSDADLEAAALFWLRKLGLAEGAEIDLAGSMSASLSARGARVTDMLKDIGAAI